MSVLFCSLWLIIGDQLGPKVKAKLVSASNKEPYLEVMGLYMVVHSIQSNQFSEY